MSVFERLKQVFQKEEGIFEKKKAGYSSGEGFYKSAAISSIFTQVDSNREAYKREFQEIQNNYLVDAILTLFTEDALTPDVTSGDVIAISSPNKDIHKKVQELQDKFDLDRIISDMTPELLSYGEYAFNLEVSKGEGIVDILDTLDYTSLVSLYKGGLPYKFLLKGNRKITEYEPYDFGHFILGPRKLRARLDGLEKVVERPNRAGEVANYPKYVRIGRPILYGVLGKIKELILLEAIVPAAKLSAISNGSLVSIEVPASTSPSKAHEICREYEDLFNKRVGLDFDSGEIRVSDIIGVAGRFKAIPSYGNKGQVNSIDVKRDSNVDDLINTIKDNREVITGSTGVPYELLFGGSQKSELLKRYSRYLRKIKAIQRSISGGVIQICLAHVNSIGLSATPKDIEIRFVNQTVNVDELEKLEYIDASTSLSSNVIDYVDKLKQNGLDGRINQEELIKWLGDRLNFVE